VALLILATALATAPGSYVRMPEPFIGESITDIDVVEPGEIEFDVTGLGIATPDRRTVGWSSGVELEYRANRLLGLALELDAGGGLLRGRRADTLYAVRAAAAIFVLNDFLRGLHAQLQLGALIYSNPVEEVIELEGAALPYFVRLHAAWRYERFNLRLTAGPAASPALPHFAATGNLSLLYDFGDVVADLHRGFVALELDADSARRFPLALIPEVAINLPSHLLAARIGVGVPVTFDPAGRAIGVGGLLRIVIEPGDDED
jgi:hypothetical protein